MADPLYELFAFALDLYRAPLKFLPYMGIDRPIPRGFDRLLEALNKREESEFWHDLSERFKTSPEQLRNAGFFLVKRLLFVDGADHYRVLGLDSTAGLLQARKRYRLLMALFHPDRSQRGVDWTEQYAPRINEAFNTLKNPQKKRAYDQGIKAAGEWGDEVAQSEGAGRNGAGRPFREDVSDSETPLADEDVDRVPPRRPTLHVWVGLVLLFLIGWFGVQVHESGGLKLVARNPGQAMPEQEPVVELSPVEGGPRINAATDVGNREGQGDLTASEGQEGTTKASDDRAALVPRVREAVATSGFSTDGGRQPNTEGEAALRAEKPSADMKTEPDTTTEPPTLEGVPEQNVSQRKKRIIISQRDIDFLVARFIQAYEAGDIGKFVGLFSSEARSNDGMGRELIAEQYRDLFRTTRQRSVKISDVNWASKADGVAGVSFFVIIETDRPGSAETEEYVGDVDLLVYMDREYLKISKFIHHVGKR